MKNGDASKLDFDDWEASHAALVGRRNGPTPEVPPSGVYWPGPVKAKIASQLGGYRWFLMSGDGRFRLAQSPEVFPSIQECEQHLRGFSPTIEIAAGVSD